MVREDFTNWAGQGERRFYNVADFIADLKAGAFSENSLTAAKSYQVGFADGVNGLGSYQWDFAPFEADYVRGYQAGQGERTPRLVRLPLGTPVTRCDGVQAVISGHSTADVNSYRVSWFDRHVWQVQHKWVERGSFEVVGAAENADEDTQALSA